MIVSFVAGALLAVSPATSDTISSAPAVGKQARLAVLQPLNLAAAIAPLDDLGEAIRRGLRHRGLQLLGNVEQDEFMARHRMRYQGGLSADLGRAFLEEEGVDAVLVTSLDRYDETNPPKVALTSRLVSTSSGAILWMDGAAIVGDQSPGFLSRGMIQETAVVRDRVIERIADSLAAHLSGEKRRSSPNRRRFRPKSSYRHPEIAVGNGAPRVAVLPFFNETDRGRAGEIVALQFVRHLVGREDVEVVEPGVVRRALLQTRVIMDEGPSFPQADLLRDLLDVDLVLAGRVTEYVDNRGFRTTPAAVFAVRAIDTRRRQVVWASSSYNRGDDRVFFFDVGKVHTTPALTSEMARQAVKRIFR